jgi:hypothetical protein
LAEIDDEREKRRLAWNLKIDMIESQHRRKTTSEDDQENNRKENYQGINEDF